MTQSKVKRKNDEIATGLQFTDVIRLLAKLTKNLLSTTVQVTEFTVTLVAKMVGSVLLGGIELLMLLVALPLKLLRYLIFGRIPKFENAAQEEAFWRIKRRYRRRFFLGLHQIIFALASLYLIIDTTTPGMYSYTHNAEPFNELLPYMLIWLIVLAGHYFYVKTANAEDEEIAKIFEQETAAKVQYVTAYTQSTVTQPRMNPVFRSLPATSESPFSRLRRKMEADAFDEDEDDDFDYDDDDFDYEDDDDYGFDHRKKKRSRNSALSISPFSRSNQVASSMSPIRTLNKKWDDDDSPF